MKIIADRVILTKASAAIGKNEGIAIGEARGAEKGIYQR